MSSIALLGVTAAAIALILFLVMVVKLHAFVTLLIVSFATAIVFGIPLGDVITTIQDGMGSTLGYVAIVVGLGAMFGEISGLPAARSRWPARWLELSARAGFSGRWP